MSGKPRLGLASGDPVVLYLHEPREKVWGLLLKLDAAGIVVRGFDLRMFEDWLRQERRGEEALIGPMTLFFPAGRLERIERDESVGPVSGYADRFVSETGRAVASALGWSSAARPKPRKRAPPRGGGRPS